MTAANGCVVEYQHNNNPHAHGNAHKVSAYQHKTLEEIKTLIEKELLDPKTTIEYQTALHREYHFEHEKHMKAVPHLEQAWKIITKMPKTMVIKYNNPEGENDKDIRRARRRW